MTHSPLRRWTLRAIVVVMSAAALHAHALPQDDAYRALVKRYRDQGPDAVSLVMAMGPAPALAAADSAQPWPADELRGALMLHTDAAIRLLNERHGADATAHLDAAVRLLGSADRQAASRRFVRQWFDTVRGYARASGAAALDLELANAERLRAPATDAYAAFERGRQAELGASLAGPLSSSGDRKRVKNLAADAIQLLTTAAREYEAALAADPAFPEAQLHLGRVRLLLQESAAAIPLLDKAAGASDGQVAYLALLFSGAAAEQQDRFGDAEAQYRKAVALFRWGQSAPIALSELLSRTGRVDDARGELTTHFERTMGRVVDPLWTYVLSPREHLEASLRQLRAEVWR